MPEIILPATARRQEEAFLARPRQAALLTAGVLGLTAVVFALVADHGTLARIQRLDDAWLRLMISGRTPAFTAMAKVFNVLGLVYVTLPVRILLAGFLALHRRWWHLAAFASAIVLSEVLIGSLKGVYDRASRPARWSPPPMPRSRPDTPSPRRSPSSRRPSPWSHRADGAPCGARPRWRSRS